MSPLPITPIPDDIHEDEEISCTNVAQVIEIISDSDSGSEENDHDGYELLSQDPDSLNPYDDHEEVSNLTNEEFQDISENNSMNFNSLLIPAPSPESFIEESNRNELNQMDEDLIETIKSVMKGITIPSSNLPQWATIVPEEVWKAQLFAEMQSKKYSK